MIEISQWHKILKPNGETYWTTAEKPGFQETRVQSLKLPNILAHRFFKTQTTAFPAQFYRELALLLEATVPLIDALRTLQSAYPTAHMIQLVERGKPMSEAFANHANTLIYPMLKIAESSGTLTPCLKKIAQYMDWQDQLAIKLKKALIYPAVLVIVFGTMIATLSNLVLPQLMIFFQQNNLPVPWSLRAFEAFEGMYVLFILSACIGTWILIGSKHQQLLLYKTHLVRDFQQLKLYQALETLIENGVPLIKAIELMRTSTRNPALYNSITEIQSALEMGAKFHHKALNDLPPKLGQILKTCEMSGNLGLGFSFVAKGLDAAFKSRSDKLVASIPPLLTILFGAVLCGIAYTLFIPLYESLTLIGH